jgi:hypothetical protein
VNGGGGGAGGSSETVEAWYHATRLLSALIVPSALPSLPDGRVLSQASRQTTTLRIEPGNEASLAECVAVTDFVRDACAAVLAPRASTRAAKVTFRGAVASEVRAALERRGWLPRVF